MPIPVKPLGDPACESLRLRLEEAGATLLAMPGGGGPRKYGSAMPDAVQEAVTGYGYSGVRLRPAIPSPAAITRMDEAFAWIGLIPADKAATGAAELVSLHGGVQLRRLVWARALVDPMSGLYLFTWAKLAEIVKADRRVLPGWHSDALGVIVAKLRNTASAPVL